MKPAVRTQHAAVYQGSCLEVLPLLPEKSVHCVVTSPPYWGLRDYGTGTWEGGDRECDHERPATAKGDYPNSGRKQQTSPGSFQYRGWPDGVCGRCGARRTDLQLGSESRPDCLGWVTGTRCGKCFVCHLTQVMREVRRVLRDDGVVWLNLGDSYSAMGGHTKQGETSQRKGRANVGAQLAVKGRVPEGIPVGNLVGIPWRVAFALQADGWTLRQDVIWSKPNPMPESVTTRCTKAHEYVFLFAKRPDYYFDHVAIQTRSDRGGEVVKMGTKSLSKSSVAGLGQTRGSGNAAPDVTQVTSPDEANKRSVWTISTKPFKGAHFAVFPPALVLPCVLAGTSAKGCCPSCGAPWTRVVEKKRKATRPGADTKTTGTTPLQRGNRDPGRHVTTVRTVGWAPGCKCDAGPPVPCTVLDPFAGTATAGYVAVKRGRRFVGVELGPKYLTFCKKRLKKGELERGFALVH